MDDHLLARFAARLSDLGVTAGLGSAVPAGPGVQMRTVRLTRGTSARAYRLLYGPRVSLADAGLARGVEPATLVFTSFMTPRSAEALSRTGVQYLDLAGNAWVQFDRVLLDVRVAPVLMIWLCPHLDRRATCSARRAHRWPSRSWPGRRCGRRPGGTWPAPPACRSGRRTMRWRC
jgi:hypothetical protein